MAELRGGDICKHLQVSTRPTTEFERVLWDVSNSLSVMDPENIVPPEAHVYAGMPKAPDTTISYGCGLGGICRGAKWYYTLIRDLDFNERAAETCARNV